MDKEIYRRTADWDVLIGAIVRRQPIIERLEQRIAQLGGHAKTGGSQRMPGLKPKAEDQPAGAKPSRQRRPHGFARVNAALAQRVERSVESCPDCGRGLAGGWVQRSREVIGLPQVPAQVAEHVYIAPARSGCGRRCIPAAELVGVVLDKGRLGINLISLIATLREDGRLPIRAIQWNLRTVRQPGLSVGAIVAAVHATA